MVGNVVYEEIKTYFEENPAMAKKIIAKSITAARAREAARKARETVRKSALSIGGLPGDVYKRQVQNGSSGATYTFSGNLSGSGAWGMSTNVRMTNILTRCV